MNRADQQTMFTALGFLAVIMRGDVPEDKQALRAKAIAKLIENFCATNAVVEAKKTAQAESSEAMSRMFANLINDNRKDNNRLRDAVEALEACFSGEAAKSEEGFISAVDKASQKFLI